MSGRRWFLAGIGAGFIVCGLVLRLAGPAGGGSEDWQAEAQRSGYLLFRPEEVDALMRSAVERAQATAPGPSPHSSTPAPTAFPPVSSPQPTFFSFEGDRVLVRIPPGSISEDVVRMLTEAGVVRDAQALRTEIAVRGKTRKIVAGAYLLEKDMPVRDVVDRITAP